MVIVLLAKFLTGAWITVILVLRSIGLMYGLHRYYQRAARLMQIDRLHLRQQATPLAVVPVSGWNRASQEALQFACSLTTRVEVLHVECPGRTRRANLCNLAGATGCGSAILGLGTAPRGNRAFTLPLHPSPVVRYVLDAEKRDAGTKVMVVVPEMVAVRWWQHLLHNHRSTALKALLLLLGNRRIVVVNVPWYLR